jgi:EAL domain-containing protein (putative c-di-GMP-specific phosphodiesterase class I)
MRWRHPVAGEIPPDVFINLAETQQMIVPLTHHLLALIARDAPALQNSARRQQAGAEYLTGPSARRRISG